MIVDNIIFNNKVEKDMIPLLKSLNKKELDKITKEINLKNKSIVILKDK